MKTIPLALLVCLLARCGIAATVQGSVFDEETSNHLARATVTLTPLPGTAGPVVSQIADENGHYSFTSVPPGWYLIRVLRIGYAIGEFGQSRPGLPGKAISSDWRCDKNSESHRIVMRHQAAVTRHSRR